MNENIKLYLINTHTSYGTEIENDLNYCNQTLNHKTNSILRIL